MTAPWLPPPSDQLVTWERQWPLRLGWEIDRLSRHGRVLGIGRAHGESDVVTIAYDWSQGAVTRRLGIIFHPGFPYIRPEIRLIGDASTFPRRHCDPFTGTLCYLGHSKNEWLPGDSIADLIATQLPKIFDGAGEEDRMGEPAENWWNQWNAVKGRCDDSSVFLIDSAWTPGHGETGSIELRADFGEARVPLVRCIADRVLDASGEPVCGDSIAAPANLERARRVTIPLVRFEAEMFPRNDDGLFDAIVDKAPGPRKLIKVREGLYARLVAAVFPTEITHGTTGWSWVLLMQTGAFRAFGVGGKAPKGTIERSVIRTFRAGPDDLRSRAPSSRILNGSNAAVVGVGAVGAPIALELARNGIAAMSMFDSDVVKPGNGVRWPLGASAWGRPKVDALAEHIIANYRDVQISHFQRRVGEADFSPDSRDRELLHRLEAADVVVDATAETGAQRYLAALAVRREKTLISVSATPTLEGGAVAVFAARGGCPVCLLRHQLDGLIPAPPGENGDAFTVELPGCAESTFAGTSFDLSELSLEAARVVVRTLADNPSRSYVETLSFNCAERLPSWRIDHFDAHADCGCKCV